MPTSEAANVAVPVRKRRNAPRGSTNISPSTSTKSPGNALATWQAHQTSRTHNGKGRRWKRCSRNLRIRSDFVASAEIKVCSRAVLPGSACAKHQATGPLPQPRAATTAPCNDIVVRSQETFPRYATYTAPTALSSNPFSTPTPVLNS